MDPAGLPALVDAIKHLHGLDATWLESVPVHERAPTGETVWEGEVQVFAVEHSKASRCYAWSHESGPGGRRKFHAVLGAGPVDSAAKAVQVAIVGDYRRAQN
jgi:hypothetical protein